MDVAVIIPLYNGSRWIRHTLTSVLRQSAPPAEIVVIDDGSTDDSTDIVREFRRVRLISPTGKGANPARRQGLAETTAPYVAMLDQDDLWHPHHLRLLGNWLDSHPACRAISGTECDFGFRNPAPAWDLTNKGVRKNDAWHVFPFGPRVGSPSAALMRRECQEEIGGWPTDFPGLADYFSWLGLSANGTPQGGMALTTACTMARRRHPSSYSASLRTGDALITYSATMQNASREAARRFGDRSALNPDQLARRLTLAGEMHAVISAFVAEDWASFSTHARNGYKTSLDASATVRPCFGAMICWLLDGRRRRSEALRLFDQAIAHWPHEDSASIALLSRRRAKYAAV